ncbi:MAG TPA: hypothetical protein VMU54_25385, partial [Planctomycetota bacterium]|nr:hypothetical protein [Planctomycetota bacterium]
MLLAVLLCGALQDTDVIPRNQRESYGVAILEYEKAWNNLDSDPRQALLSINRLFQLKIEKKDRRIQMERPNGTLQKPFDFFPNYLRGRIRLALAKSDPDNAQAYLSAAIGDFKSSSDAGVKASEDLLKSTRALLDRLKAPKPPESPPKVTMAEEGFRESWFKQIEAHKFKAARDLVDQKGTSLAADRKRDYVRDTEEECRKYVGGELSGFAKAMELSSRPAQLRSMRLAEWNRIFELPADADLVGSYPELDWARKEKPTLELVRTSTSKAREEEYPAVLDRLLAQLAAAE